MRFTLPGRGAVSSAGALNRPERMNALHAQPACDIRIGPERWVS